MKILIAPNAFKGTIPADRAAALIKEVLSQHLRQAEFQLCPIADGGDGTCLLLGKQLGLSELQVMGLDAIGRVKLGLMFLNKSQKTVLIDVATVSGLEGLDSALIDAKASSSYGTGLLVLEAISQGADHIILGLGGSATVDMGTGILRALGFLFLDEHGREIPVFSPGFLSKVAYIQRSPIKHNIRFTCLCDVNNTFFGKEGAIPVFGPQKGLKDTDQQAFEEAAKRVFELMKAKGKGALEDQPGFGAAGGIALGLSAFFPVAIKQGAHYFFERVEMEEKVKWADWVITGEGRFDRQSSAGKGSYELLQLAQQQRKKAILITSGGEEEGIKSGFDEVVNLPELDFSLQNISDVAEKYLKSSLKEFLSKCDFGEED
ncbi:glycerate kinase [Echinicola strongylocentroti]|uniref:Glycerate kinase n=1 Tax=Echinicola strongylocentroti TaxID=1795355 RepID=A0A2Z4IFV9_9BACT|nr:glycerate kinase [Echinicola strongylocentroti]AWW29333.1 glycerate kinase [Echinicola strongylocentroti]